MRFIVNVADMKISANREDELVTFALGSCLGVVVYDPIACVGGMLHVMLPISNISREKARVNPYLFVDTGVPQLFFEAYKAGAVKERLIVKVAGGACANVGQEDHFQIGQRNIAMLERLFQKNGINVTARDIAGHNSRTLSLEIDTGIVKVSSLGKVRIL